MRSATLYHYDIPLEAGTVLRDRRLKSRQGWLVKLTENGAEGWGEISPLPGFSTERAEEAEQAAVAWLSAWQSGQQPAESALPSVAFGLSCALAECAGALPAQGNWQSATLCSGDPDALFEHLRQQQNPVAKMKVGLYEPVRDGMMVNLLLEALPGLTLRLDANRSWTLEKARAFARYVATELRGRIAFIEEPCRDMNDARQFAAETGIALAFDESSRENGYQPAAEPHLRAIVIKPTLVGSVDRVKATIAAAHDAGLIAVISSSLESSLGLTQLARLANAFTPGVLPGLDTLDLMQYQLVRPWPGSPLPLRGETTLSVRWSQ